MGFLFRHQRPGADRVVFWPHVCLSVCRAFFKLSDQPKLTLNARAGPATKAADARAGRALPVLPPGTCR